MKTPRRTKSVGAKVTEQEYVGIQDAAGAESVSDWLREVAITAAQRAPSNQVELLMAEVLALRRILLHSLPLSISVEQMDRLVADADAAKIAQARARLEREREA